MADDDHRVYIERDYAWWWWMIVYPDGRPRSGYALTERSARRKAAAAILAGSPPRPPVADPEIWNIGDAADVERRRG